MPQARIAEILRQSPDFGFVPSEVLHGLAQCSRLLALRPGELLWRVGDPAREVFVPEVGGLVRAGQGHPDGAYVNTGLVFLGHLIGEVEVLGGITTRFNEAEALSACQLVQVPAPAFNDFVASVPWVKDYWLRMAHIRHSMVMKQAYAMSRRSAQEKLRGLVGVLLEYMPLREGDRLKLPFKQEILGRMADLSRQATNKVLGEWQQQGVIDIGYQALFIAQPEYFKSQVQALASG